MTTIAFTIPYVMPTLNTRLRTHWGKNAKDMRRLAWEISARIRLLPPCHLPMPRAAIRIVRYSARLIDPDGLAAAHKGLIDCLCAVSKSHPFGLGVILDDSPAHITLDVSQVKSTRKEARTWVTITALDD